MCRLSRRVGVGVSLAISTRISLSGSLSSRASLSLGSGSADRGLSGSASGNCRHVGISGSTRSGISTTSLPHSAPGDSARLPSLPPQLPPWSILTSVASGDDVSDMTARLSRPLRRRSLNDSLLTTGRASRPIMPIITPPVLGSAPPPSSSWRPLAAASPESECIVMARCSKVTRLGEGRGRGRGEFGVAQAGVG